MNLYKNSQLISFINRRKNPYVVKRLMTNYMLQYDEKHQKPSYRPFPRIITAAVETKPDLKGERQAVRHKARIYHNQQRPKSAVKAVWVGWNWSVLARQSWYCYKSSKKSDVV
nr:PREDICTED: uncharacterized protein LOC108832629 isoform X2 [Raphanus sativus]